MEPRGGVPDNGAIDFYTILSRSLGAKAEYIHMLPIQFKKKASELNMNTTTQQGSANVKLLHQCTSMQAALVLI